MDGSSPASEYEVTVGVAICTPPRNTRYAVTPTLSDEANHDKLTTVSETPVTASPAGTVGAWVSGAAAVVALTLDDCAEALLAASTAATV